MDNEKKDRIDSNEVPDADSLVQEYQNYQQNYVEKSKYEKLQEDYDKVRRALFNGEKLEGEKSVKVDIDQLRKDLYSGEKQLTNLEGITKTIQLRDAIIAEGGDDPFLGGVKNPNPADIEKAEHVAQIFKECIEYADGDSELFTNELMRRTVDTSPQQKRR